MRHSSQCGQMPGAISLSSRLCRCERPRRQLRLLLQSCKVYTGGEGSYDLISDRAAVSWILMQVGRFLTSVRWVLRCLLATKAVTLLMLLRRLLLLARIAAFVYRVICYNEPKKYKPAINSDGTRIAFRSNFDLTSGNAAGDKEIFSTTRELIALCRSPSSPMEENWEWTCRLRRQRPTVTSSKLYTTRALDALSTAKEKIMMQLQPSKIAV